MKIFNWLKSSKTDGPKSKRQPRRLNIKGRYDSAQTTDENSRHWVNADSLSAKRANSKGVRKILRDRARYEIANNSYAKGMVTTLANDVIGTGPRLQLLGMDDETNNMVEAAFLQWSESIKLCEKMRTMMKSLIGDGESFAVKINNFNLGNPVSLDIRLMEADQITTPFMTPIPSLRRVDGIEFDEFGNPETYHVLRNHPGDSLQFGIRFDRVPAQNIIHIFKEDRPGQVRGIPEITPALPLYAQLRRFTLATLTAAETAAMYSAVLHTNSGPDTEADPIDPMDVIDIERNMMLTLPEGWNMSQFKSEHPTTTYKEFKNEIINEIAVALSMPFNVAAGNSSGYNYASGRLDHQTYFKLIKVYQRFFEREMLDRLFADWVAEASRIPDLIPRSMSVLGSSLPHAWFWDGSEHVDPLRESKAQDMRIRNLTTNYAREYALQGLDWRKQFEQIKREKDTMKEMGINLADVEADLIEMENVDDTPQPQNQ